MVCSLMADSGLPPAGRCANALTYATDSASACFSRLACRSPYSVGGEGGATEVRARQLGIQHCLVGVKDKLQALEVLQRELNIAPVDTVFIGDDLNDLAVRPLVGLLVAPADACAPMRHRADLVLRGCGGHGAVRELAEKTLRARDEWSELQREGWRDCNE